MPGKSSEPLHHVPFTGALWVLTKALDCVDSNDMTKFKIARMTLVHQILDKARIVRFTQPVRNVELPTYTDAPRVKSHIDQRGYRSGTDPEIRTATARSSHHPPQCRFELEGPYKTSRE